MVIGLGSLSNSKFLDFYGHLKGPNYV